MMGLLSLLPGGRAWKFAAGAAGMGVLALAALDWGAARQARTGLRRCEAAATAPARPTEGCPGPVAEAIAAQRRATACEAALKTADLFGIRAACGPQVLAAHARLTAAEHDLADARAGLAQAERRTIAAVSRADARAKSTAERNAHAAAALSAALSAAGDAGGLHACDAACLRALAGGAPGPDR